MTVISDKIEFMKKAVIKTKKTYVLEDKLIYNEGDVTYSTMAAVSSATRRQFIVTYGGKF